jgi:hypothetical protein
MNPTQQGPTHAGPLVLRTDIGMPYKFHCTADLKTHNGKQFAFLVYARENYSVLQFLVQLLYRHIRLVPAVLRNYPPVDLSRRIDHGTDLPGVGDPVYLGHFSHLSHFFPY